jgi:hypothetical protein
MKKRFNKHFTSQPVNFGITVRYVIIHLSDGIRLANYMYSYAFLFAGFAGESSYDIYKEIYGIIKMSILWWTVIGTNVTVCKYYICSVGS